MAHRAGPCVGRGRMGSRPVAFQRIGTALDATLGRRPRNFCFSDGGLWRHGSGQLVLGRDRRKFRPAGSADRCCIRDPRHHDAWTISEVATRLRRETDAVRPVARAVGRTRNRTA